MRTSIFVVLIFAIQFTISACDIEQSKLALANLTWVTEDYPPYNYIDHQKKVTGIFTDVLLLAYQELEIPVDVKNITVMPWARLYHKLSFEEGIAAFSMTNTIERSKRFKLISLPYQGKISIMVKQGRETELAKKELKDIVIAVVREDIGHHLLNQYEIPSVQVHTTSAHAMLKMLLHDRVDAIAYAEEVANFQFEKLGIGSESLISLYTLEENMENSYIFHRNTESCVIKLFQSTINVLFERGEIDTILSHYLKE